MPTQNRLRTTERSAARERRAARTNQAQTKANRAQLRAMEIRESETRIAASEMAATHDAADVVAEGRAASLPSRAVTATRRAVARPLVLTKEQEYRFIRSDLRRLGTTAGALFVVMIVLLFVVD